METGTQPQTALELFEYWSPVHETHTKRYMGIIGRHLSIMGQWVDALKLPIDSFEHQVIVERLNADLSVLYEESKETLETLSADYLALKQVFELFQLEIVANNIKEIVEKDENVS